SAPVRGLGDRPAVGSRGPADAVPDSGAQSDIRAPAVRGRRCRLPRPLPFRTSWLRPARPECDVRPLLLRHDGGPGRGRRYEYPPVPLAPTTAACRAAPASGNPPP